MSPRDDKPTQETLADAVIGNLYEVAIDPSRYETLLDHWEEMMRPQRVAANDLKEPYETPEAFESHFVRADQVLDQLMDQSTKSEAEAILAKIERTAAFVVDQTLTVTGVNTVASSVLGVTKGARVSDLALREGEAQALANQIGRMLRGNSAEPVVARTRSARTDRLIMLHLRLVRPETTPAFVVAVTSEISWPEGFSSVLQSAFGLSPAEVKVVRALAEAKTLAEISQDRNRSIDTIRSQLKSIMGKTETRSQTELVRLTLTTMELAHTTTEHSKGLTDSSTGTGTLQQRPFLHVTLPDGRRLEYLILGDPDGKPLLFFPLDFGLVRWPASAEDEATKRGIKIIVPVRPGYGKSTPVPKNQPHSVQVVDDLEFLLDELGIGPLPFMTLGGDTYLAFNYFASHPERMTALIANAGVLPLTQPEQYDRMDKWHRFILAGARYTPHLLPFMVKAGFALARRVGKRGFIHAVYGKSAADVATFEIPEVFEAMVCGSDVALSDTHSAHDAFSREVIHQETTDWSEEVEAIKGKVPVHFLNGLQDPQIHPDTLKDFQRDYPWVDFRIYPDAGQLVFFLKWRDSLALVEKYLR